MKPACVGYLETKRNKSCEVRMMATSRSILTKKRLFEIALLLVLMIFAGKIMGPLNVLGKIEEQEDEELDLYETRMTLPGTSSRRECLQCLDECETVSTP